MDNYEIELLLDAGESDRLEMRESVSDPDRIRRTICAFANDLSDHRKPAALLIGMRDDGSCADLAITDDLLCRLAEMRADGKITPFPRIEVRKVALRGCRLAAVIVHPSDSPPVRFDLRIYVRIGPTTRQASIAEERGLTERRPAHDLPFDMRPVSTATSADIDIDLFVRTYLPAAVPPEVLELNAREPSDQLASMRFLTPDGIPTVAGLLVLGRDPRDFIPGAYIQFVRFDGKSMTDDIKDQEEIDGPLPDLLRSLDDKLKAHVSTVIDLRTGATDIRRPDFPIVALRQFLYNAVMHRMYEATNAPVRFSWFSDRIEILSPGGPYGLVTPENFGKPGVTDYRNPQLAEAMKNLGYVQRFGVGIQIARQELEKNGNPPPDFDVRGPQVLVAVGAQS